MFKLASNDDNTTNGILSLRNPETFSPARKKATPQHKALLELENLTASQLNIFQYDASDSDSADSAQTTSASDITPPSLTQTSSQCSAASKIRPTPVCTQPLNAQGKFKQKEKLLISEGVILTDLALLNKQISAAEATLGELKKTRCNSDEELNLKAEQEILLEEQLQSLLKKREILNLEYNAIKQKQERYKIDDTVDRKFWSAKSAGRGQQSLTHLWDRLPSSEATPPKATDIPVATAPKANHPTAPKYKAGDIRFYSQPPVIDLTKSPKKLAR